MNEPQSQTAAWRKSSRSNQAGGCVEVRRDLAAVRDSKHLGPALRVNVAGLAAWIKQQ